MRDAAIIRLMRDPRRTLTRFANRRCTEVHGALRAKLATAADPILDQVGRARAELDESDAA